MSSAPIPGRLSGRKDTKRKVALGFVLVLAAVLIAGRIYLPYWLKGYVNGQIDRLDHYSGSVSDIDVALWRGAYQIEGLAIYKSEGGLERPFAAADTVDLSIEWRALWHGEIVAEIDLFNADLNFAKSQTGEGAGWVGFVDALSPFDINRLEIHGGKLSYIDYTVKPNVDLYIKDIDARVTNLRNVEEEDAALPSDIVISGTSIGGGALSVKGHMNILKEIPDFDMGLELNDADLTAFNNYVRPFAAIDFESGTIGVYAEMAAANGYVTGYVKPVANGISVVSAEHDQNPFNIIWESIASFFIEIFENQSSDQFAMRIPIEGDLNNPDRDMWRGFLSIFSNAFGRAFSKNEDGSINFKDALAENSRD